MLSLLIKTMATGSCWSEHTFEFCTFNLSPQLQGTGYTACHYFLGFTNEEAAAWRGLMTFVQITPMGVSFMSPAVPTGGTPQPVLFSQDFVSS